MKELIEQEAEKLKEVAGHYDPGMERRAFLEGVYWMQRQYTCTPEHVKEMRELLKAIKPVVLGGYIPIRLSEEIAGHIEKLLNEKS